MLNINVFSKLFNGGDVYAHCDLMCGVYDPAQARIEAQSVYNAIKIHNTASDDIYKQRALIIKEERAELAKHHIWVLWTDYFKPEHAEKFDNLHSLVWEASKAAGNAKKSVDIEDAQKLIDLIDQIGRVFEQTKEGYEYDRVLDNISMQSK